ncbi:MAG TPA: YdcH family protein [Rugosibacter sp.]|nr:YdcH family protein [Rugosibacter sp.]HQQ36095.1 YdcH family protein [Rugosibacter sp.]
MTDKNPPTTEQMDSSDKETEEILRAQLEALREEHRQLDVLIGQITTQPADDELLIRRMKKRKLLVKDTMRTIEKMLDPDPDEYA